MPQSQPDERVPVWRTQFVRRERARPESVSSASSLSSTHTEGAEAQHHHSPAGNTLDPFRRENPRIPPPREGPPAHDDVEGQLPQPEGFVGLAITLDLLYARLKSASAQELSYHDRLNHCSLDASILGQGASFTVLKRLGQCTGLEDMETNDEDTSFDGDSSAMGKSSSSNSDAHEVFPVVMKVPRVSFDRNGNPHDVEQLKALLSEIQVMSALALQGHSNIIRLLEIQWDHPKLDRERLGPTLYVEYAELGTLTDYLTLGTPIAQQALQEILLEVAHGLTALHQCGVIHGDLKLSNVLLCKDKTGEITAKLSDFGCSIIIANESATKARLRGRSPPWDAPEAIGPIPKALLHKTDIYSFGLLYWRVMMGGADPFDLDRNSPNSIFAFDGDRGARIEAAQRMKAEQDMGEWMYQSVRKHRSNTQELEPDMEIQLCVVGAATLTVDPYSRDLEIVVEALNSSREASPSTGQQRGMVPSKLPATKLRPGQAWDLKLCWVRSDSAIAGRFVEALKYLSSSSDKPKCHRMNASILLFRCYLEGFGVSNNPRLSIKHAIEAAEFGDPFAKSIIPGIHRIFGASVPAHLPLVDWLAEAVPHNTRNTIEDKIDPARCSVALNDWAMQLVGDSLISSEDALIQYLESHVPSELPKILDARFGTLPIRMSCVQLAACFGWTNALKMLLDENGSYNCKSLLNWYDSHGHTPLLGACAFGQADAVMILLEHGANAALNHLANGISALHYLVELTRNRSCVRNDVYDIAFSLVSAGADPNAPFVEQESDDSVRSDLDQKFQRESMRFQYRVPLSRAIWLGDVEAVKCLLDVGAMTDLVCLEMAVQSHQVDAFEALLASDSQLSRSFNIDGPTSLGTTLLGLALDENEVDTPITPFIRTLLSKQSPSDSAMSMVQCLLRHGASSTLGTSDDDGNALHWLWYLAVEDRQVDNRIMEILWQQAPAELEDSSEGFNLLECSLLHSKTDMAHFLLHKGSDPTKWSDIELSTLHLCAAYTDDASLCRKLLERYQHPDIEADHGGMGTDITTPFQLAVAHQHFGVADCLYEAGANRDYAATDPKDSDRSKTLLGWLLEDVWSESQVRIEYLFERYPDEAPPAFIVRPIVCWSALQAAAHRTPRNTLEETDAGNLMEYMLSKYRGGLHVEYERVNKKERENDIAGGSGTIRSGFESYNDTSARKQAVDPTFFQHQLGATGSTDDEPDLNNYGTALHFAVRAVNFPAVQALIRAGAKTSPTLGPQKRGRIYSDSYEGVYTSKVDSYASTPLDYAILTHERLQQGTWPRCFGGDKPSPAVVAHLQRRSRDIIQLLTQFGASNGSKYIRKRGEANVWKERKEKGNVASMKMFGDMLKKDFSFARSVCQKAYKEGIKDFAIDHKKREDRAKTKFEAETGLEWESDSNEQTSDTE